MSASPNRPCPYPGEPSVTASSKNTIEAWCHGMTSLHVSSLVSFPLCLYPAPSLSPSNSIQPCLPAFCSHLPAFHHLCSNSKVYSCNHATSTLRPALD